MKNCLLLLMVGTALVSGVPAYSQYLFLDVNGDGQNSQNPAEPGTGADILLPGVTSIDVYFDTNHNPDGTAATCNASSNKLTINSYEILLRSSGSGTITFNSWTDNMGFTFGIIIGGDHTLMTAGTDVWIGRGSATAMPPGRYKVGTLGVTVTGEPALTWLPLGGSTLNANAETAFGTQCEGNDFDNTYKLGNDFPSNSAFGVAGFFAAVEMTWGEIKQKYR